MEIHLEIDSEVNYSLFIREFSCASFLGELSRRLEEERSRFSIYCSGFGRPRLRSAVLADGRLRCGVSMVSMLVRRLCVEFKRLYPTGHDADPVCFGKGRGPRRTSFVRQQDRRSRNPMSVR